MNYYISDLHLGQHNICILENRPFGSTEEMDARIIENWNSRVEDEDTVYILGDFVWLSDEHWQPYLTQLRGRKVLIRGNHDPESFSDETAAFFDEIADYKEIYDGERLVILCHYPMPFHKTDYKKNIWMLYGHVHDTREYAYLRRLRAELKATVINPWRAVGNFVNVGCMMPWMDYTPRTLDEIIKCNY